MATSFKTFLNSDITTTRTLLHEAVPITGAVLSGTYEHHNGNGVPAGSGGTGTDKTQVNQKTYAHGMFSSIYDYPYLSSSANHIIDVTAGFSNASGFSGSTRGDSGVATVQNAKKINIYNQMAQMLAGYDESGAIRDFDIDGNHSSTVGKMKEVYFINFSRLLTKDEIKKGSFNLTLAVSGGFTEKPRTSAQHTEHAKLVKLTDASGSNGFKTNSPAGEYGILFATGSANAAAAQVDGQQVGGVGDLHSDPISQKTMAAGGTSNAKPAGLIFYQAGIAVVTASIFNTASVTDGAYTNNEGMGLLEPANVWKGTGVDGALVGTQVIQMDGDGHGVDNRFSYGTIAQNAESLMHRITDISFNNTTELNSTVYFCRANHNEFNYSSNPTYLADSKMVVKNSTLDSPVTYLTTVGMYSANNELLAVAKLSEPIKKDPTNEVTLRVRLDY